MATIKVPYTYKEYTFSKLATRVDKFCHKPSRIVWCVVSIMLLVMYYSACFSVIPLPDSLERALGNVGAIAIGVVFFGSFFLGLLCDKCKISERIALWDIAGRKVSGAMKVVIVVLAALLILPGIAAGCIYLVNAGQANAYHETMSVLDSADSTAVEGDKAVTLAEDRYSRLYIPEEYQAQTPEEVRYILRCTDGDELQGFYGTSGIQGYKRWRMVEIVDRQTGQVIASETFFGSDPPRSVSDDASKKQYGSYPDEEKISHWVSQMLSPAP